MKRLITMFAVGALAAGPAFADKGKGEKKEGEKPKAARAEGDAKPEGKKRPEGDRKRPEGKRGNPGERMLKALDKDESGDISFDEFKSNPRAKDAPEDKVKARFDKMDGDSDGKVTQAEITAMFKAMMERRKDQGGDKPKGDRPKRPEGDAKKRPEGEKKKKGDE